MSEELVFYMICKGIQENQIEARKISIPKKNSKNKIVPCFNNWEAEESLHINKK